MTNYGRPKAGWGFSCVKEIALTSIIPSIGIFVLIRKAAPLNRASVGWLTLTCGAAFGAVATPFSCPMSDPLHLLIWHALPVLAIGTVGKGLGNLILKKV